MRTVKRIIVVDLLYLGDLLFAHPFFEGLRELFPEARIDLVANSNFSEIMRANPNINHVYSYNKNWTVIRSYKFAKKLKMNKYDLGVNIHGNWRTALLLKLISADKSIGYGGKGRGLFLDEKVENNTSSHMVELYLDFFNQMQQSQLLETNFELQKLNFDSEKNSVPVLRVDEAYNQSAERKLDNIGLKDEFIVLNTGGSWKTKRWPEEYFAETADQLAERGFNVLFVGGPSDTVSYTHLTLPTIYSV